MNDNPTQVRAVELLQELGLKEYEARCFVALTRIPQGTAKDVSEIADVPRTRVYDAVEELEVAGLVEVQPSSPQQFRAQPISEATETLRRQYDERIEELTESVSSLDPWEDRNREQHGIWTLSTRSAVANRTRSLVEDAREELVLLLCDGDVLSESLLDRLRSARDRDVDVFVGARSADVRNRLLTAVPDAHVVDSWLDLLQSPEAERETISHVVTVDRTSLLIGATEDDASGESTRTAIWSTGSGNGLVAITRRLLSAGLDLSEQPSD